MTVDELLKNKTIQKQKIANNSEKIKKDFIETILDCRKKFRDKCAEHDKDEWDIAESSDDDKYDLAKLFGIELGIESAYLTVFGGQAFTDLMITIFNSEAKDNE